MADDPTPQIPSNSPAPGDTIAMLRDYVGAWRERIRAR